MGIATELLADIEFGNAAPYQVAQISAILEESLGLEKGFIGKNLLKRQSK